MSDPCIVLGVTGGIAAYKAADIVRGLQDEGAEVAVILTDHGREFITPLTLATLSGRQVITSQFDLPGGGAGATSIEHIDLARRCRLLLVAPATANVLGKMAAGIADDFLSTFYLALNCPVAVAPAMNTAMWNHPAVQSNMQTLRARGVRIMDPEFGRLASRGEGQGVGRLAGVERIVRESMAIVRETSRDARRADRAALSGIKVLVTAGPTREHLDPVRFISSPSSGKMGFAVARAARTLGAEVTLVAGPTDRPDPDGITTLHVTTAREMRDAVMAHLEDTRVVVKAASVSDFRPARRAGEKIKKENGVPRVDLVLNPDILSEIVAAQGERF
ncbi:MAG: bifunctional phosphopantothenoylcysteine decarboxylase/phosphopantothenate--cysteine ligase CoaBC, partial [Acidobacteriota bacterium]